MKKLPFFWLGLWLTALTLVSVFLLDHSLARSVRSSGFEGNRFLSQGTVFLDTVSGKLVSKFLLGAILVVAGLVLRLGMKVRRWGAGLLFAGSVQLLCTLVTGVSKNVFGRLRPFESLNANTWDHTWFIGGSSFPSGHAGYYWGLFLPLIFLFPRYRYWFLVVPVFISVARIIGNDHFLGDVTGSVAICAFLVQGMAVLFRKERLRREER